MSKPSYSLFIILASLIVVSNGLVDEAKAPIAAPSMAPSPSWDPCTSILYENMIECFLFLVDDSTESKPDAACCAGYESVVKINPDCICEALNYNMDLPINMTKAVSLPSTCGTSQSPDCTLSGPTPAPAPGLSGPSPGLAPEEPPTAAISPSEGLGPEEPPTADISPSSSPSPSLTPSSIVLSEGPASSQKGGVYSTSASAVLPLVSMMVVYFF